MTSSFYQEVLRFKPAKFTGNLDDLNTRIGTLKNEAQRKAISIYNQGSADLVRPDRLFGRSPGLTKYTGNGFKRFNIPIGDIRSIHMLGTEDARGFEIILDY